MTLANGAVVEKELARAKVRFPVVANSASQFKCLVFENFFLCPFEYVRSVKKPHKKKRWRKFFSVIQG